MVRKHCLLFFFAKNKALCDFFQRAFLMLYEALYFASSSCLWWFEWNDGLTKYTQILHPRETLKLVLVKIAHQSIKITSGFLA